ncbi:hypothetical protein KGF56_004503 [Candida oxycetoniae]|uniref:(S)-ureidoglycine aminohydrolase cupin domain-containing protein n=1 Tax=Candida oxycetoniae TaxID=497107 RepID=A0AAI9ST76_9ASCO|nr:uncharacterized protein KGF56_004503 [Candida oxycetoniae]KAI3402622.1 hypothetical protein KGF56_004503 [Candida oxycetoniae]
MPMQYRPAAEGREVKPSGIPSPGNNAYLSDVFTSNAPEDKKISCGFFRLEKGEALTYNYTYDEMKIFLEVEGEYTLTDETGFKVNVSQGDVFYFPKGSTITFETTGYGLAFFTGSRPNGAS